LGLPAGGRRNPRRLPNLFTCSPPQRPPLGDGMSRSLSASAARPSEMGLPRMPGCRSAHSTWARHVRLRQPRENLGVLSMNSTPYSLCGSRIRTCAGDDMAATVGPRGRWRCQQSSVCSVGNDLLVWAGRGRLDDLESVNNMYVDSSHLEGCLAAPVPQRVIGPNSCRFEPADWDISRRPNST
jgi:hypothetical protein